MLYPLLSSLFQQGQSAVIRRGRCTGAVVEWASPSVQNLLGLQPDQLSSSGLAYTELIHPEDRAAFEAEQARYLSGDADNHEHADYRIRHASGCWVWVKDHTSLYRDEHQQVAVVSFLTDVSGMHVTQARLEEERERFQLVLESTRLGIWDWHLPTNQVVFDRGWAEMLGYGLGEIEPCVESWSSRVHPEDLDDAMATVQAHVAGETTFYEHVHRLRHKAGHWVWILDRGRVVEYGPDGTPLRFTGTHTNITPQKEAELAAQEANQAKSYFLARMSHEIRTPLNGVLGILQLLTATELSEQQGVYVDTIRESGQTLLTIINDVLDVAKVEAGEMRLNEHPFPLERSLRLVYDLYAETALRKGLDYTLDLAPDLPEHLVGDDHRLRQVLSNLVSNAMKFTDAGSVRVRVTAARMPGQRVMFSADVVDTGTGITNVEGVFEAFRQDNARVFGTRGGTGLGLSISRELVRAMGGTLTVDSVVGRGSTFQVRIPLTTTQAEAKRSQQRERATELAPLRILVAEDNLVNTMVIRGVLRQLGQEPTLVTNGREAVEACRRQAFDLVLMDIHMPEMDGLQAARSITAELGPAAPRIVAISADAFGLPESERRAAGMDHSIAKPFDIGQIERVLVDTPVASEA